MADQVILVADDDAFIRDSIGILIRRNLGCHVELVQDGDSAYAYLRQNPVDILIADMMMPGLQGLDLIEAARQAAPEMDIVVMTGYTEDFPYVQVVNAGATDIIGKPYAQGELLAKLMRVFQERETREALMNAEKKYRSIFELNTDGMVIADSRTLEVLDANTAFCHLTGDDPAKLIGRNILTLMPESERERFESGTQLCIRVGHGTLGDIKFCSQDGEEIYLDISITHVMLANEEVVCMTFKDVTEKRVLEQRLTDVAQKDALTSLYNKRTFVIHLNASITAARCDAQTFCLLAIDVDNFKHCNDTFGHPAGDELLQNIGRIMLKNIRTNQDEAFRCGGDEFSILLHNINADAAKGIADRIRREFESSQSYGTSLSIGIAMYQPGMTADALCRAADEALYQAKALGKNNSWVA